MITISLDEQGDFENLEQENAPIFIGGVIYDDEGDEEDTGIEKERVVAYLRKVCEDTGNVFPRDLHFTRFAGGGNNGGRVAEVKQKLGETLQEFLEEGTYNGQTLISKRGGKYYIFTMLKSEAGQSALLGSNVSELTRDDIASNLYLHMAEDIITRLVFHNPVIEKITKIKPDLATRRVVLKKSEFELQSEFYIRTAEYQKLGYRMIEEDSDSEQHVYQLTNPYNYRTALVREMVNTERHDIAIEHIGVKSIYYGGGQNTAERMAFLYIADIICAHMGFQPEGDTPREWMECFEKRIHKLLSNRPHLLFGYDTVDAYFRKAWNCLEEKDYYKALSIAYEGTVCKSEFREFYAREWFPRIQQKLLAEKDVSAYKVAVKKFYESIYKDNLNQEKLVYIYETLIRMADNMQFSGEHERAELFDLYSAGISVYNFVGESDKAEEQFLKCKEFVAVVGVEKYLRTLNKMVSNQINEFRYEKALENARENFRYQEYLVELKKEIFKDKDFDTSLGHAIACSQLGMAYAFLQRPEAEHYFLEALEDMEKDSPNYYITLSYLLHHYITCDNQKKYEEYAAEYFAGCIKLREQLNFLKKQEKNKRNPRFSVSYALFVFVKGIYRFYGNDLSEGLLKDLQDIDGYLGRSFGEETVVRHPWEAIYKYLAFIMLRSNREEVAQQYMKKVNQIGQEPGFTMEAVVMFANGQFSSLTGDEAQYQQWMEQLSQLIKLQCGAEITVDEDLFAYMY